MLSHRRFESLIRASNRTRERKSKKDLWDKADIFGRLIAGIALAAGIGLLNWNTQQAQIEATNRNAQVQIEAARQNAQVQVEAVRQTARSQVEQAERLQRTQAIFDVLQTRPGDPRFTIFQSLTDNSRLATLLDGASLQRFQEIEQQYGTCRNDFSTACQNRVAAIIGAYRSYLGREKISEELLLSFIFGNNIVELLQRALIEGEPWPPPERAEPLPTPAPAPPAALPLAVQPQTYLLFFDWNSTSLSPHAREILTEVAQAWRRLRAGRIEIFGHADTSEGLPRHTEQTARRLSFARSEEAAAFMLRSGIPRTAVGIAALGESSLLIQTPPNVREPQNRRVAVVLREAQ